LRAAQNGEIGLLNLLLRAPKKVTEPYITRGLLPAAANGCVPIALLLVQAGANGDYENASALMYAVESGNASIAASMVSGKSPPSAASLNRALDRIFSSTPNFINNNFDLIDILLCGGPVGNAANEGILKATILGNVGIVRLLLFHNVDTNYNDGAAVAHTIQQNRLDLFGILLQEQILKPEIASDLVGLIPRAASSTDKVAVLSKLLANGASGVHCSEILATAADQNDLETARLLISARDQTGHPICSVDYDAARCLKISVAKNYLPMTKILLKGGPSKVSLSTTFTSIPPNTKVDDRFLLVQSLLWAGLEGPVVDAALVAAVNDEPKPYRLIELLVHSGAVVDDQTLYSVVSQCLVDILEILLMGKVPAQTCSLAISIAMKAQNVQVRYHMVNLLLGPAITLDASSPEAIRAIIELLQNYPEDKPLLQLLCRDGKANINLHGGFAVELATRNADPEILNIILQASGDLPNPDTVEKGLQCAIELPPADPNRKHKIILLLRHAKPEKAINEALVVEIKSVLTSKQDLSVIQILLEAGANVNALDGESIVFGVRHPAIMDLLLSKRLSPQSFSKAFYHAVSFDEPERYSLCEKLLRVGPPVDAVSMALSTVVEEGLPAIPLIKLLLPHADVNFNQGKAMVTVVQQAFIEGVNILLTPRATMPSAATMAGAFQAALQIKKIEDRHAIVTRLLNYNLPKNAISDALVAAVNSSDIKLVEALLQSGASIEYGGGQAILNAANSGQVDILNLLIGGKLCAKPPISTFMSAFGGAMSLKGKDAKSCYLVLQILLEAGVRGNAVNAALVDVAKDGDANLEISELLCEIGKASVEWNEGEALDFATISSSIGTINLLLRQQPSQAVLNRAYKSASNLSKDPRYHVIQLLLNSGKSINKDVADSLTSATKQTPIDHRLIKLLVDHETFDEGESIANAVRARDLKALGLLLSTPRAVPYISSSFKNAIGSNFDWKSNEGLSIMRLLLEKGASGDVLGEALSKAVENFESSPKDQADNFVDVLLRYGADINHQGGLALQRAAAHMNVDLLQKLLPAATIESKAISIPYLFASCDDSTKLVKALQVFSDSFQEDNKDFLIGFTHPDSHLEPVLFIALDHSPKKPQVLKALLDLGYNPNQWIPRGIGPTLNLEPWPVLFWAIEQPEKRISNTNISLLIDGGGKFIKLFSLSPSVLLSIIANVNFKSKSGLTPLMLAIQHHRSEIVSQLLSKEVNVNVLDQNGISPLSLASRLGNPAIIEHLLRAGAEGDDGSLHDAARELRCDTMRILIKYGHKPDYPSERHEGRSALAELCLNAVNCHPIPKGVILEEAVQCLVAGGANIRLRSLSDDMPEKTIFHFALDSSNPMLILPVLLKVMWEYVNEDCFLYKDATYTYSLTKYVEKELYQGPRDQRDSIIRALKNKRVIDRFWATDVEAEQPDDWCGAPDYIKNEVIRQKLRRKQKAEEHQDAMAALELKRMTTLRSAEIMGITTAAEIRAEREKAQAAMQLLAERAEAQMRLDARAEGERLRLLAEKHAREVEHMRVQAGIQLSTQRALKQEALNEERARNMLQIEQMDTKNKKESEGRRAVLAIDSQSREDQERHDKRMHEREMARVKMQKSLVETSTRLAGSLQGSGMTQRQIGYITGEVP
jgi:hypothetical protein